MRSLKSVVKSGDRGASAVEAALILPVFILLIFGTIEFSLLLRDYVGTTYSIRAGVRIASAQPRVDGFTQTAADTIATQGSALPKDSIEYIYVYKANSSGYPGSAASAATAFATCPDATCDKFTWDAVANKFVSVGAVKWDANTINACPGTLDSVGVYMRVKHQWVTRLFVNTSTIEDYSVNTFEPMRRGSCS
jgi:Flp pilus assembly protein TadG